MPYPQHYDGEVIILKGDPGKQRLRMSCCDCDLVHDVYATITDDGRVALRIDRNQRATAQLRRHSKRRVISDG